MSQSNLTERARMVDEKVRGIVSHSLGVDLERVVDAAELIKDLGADSIDLMELAIRLEDGFFIKIGEGQAELVKVLRDTKTVGELIKMIQPMM